MSERSDSPAHGNLVAGAEVADVGEHRVPRRRVSLKVLGTCVVAVAVLSPLAVHAVTPTFTDVGVSHPFFDEIEWMADTGISTGYPDGTYRPNDPVTRQAMSAFMQRLYDVQDDSSWNFGTSGPTAATTTWTDLPGATGTVTVPDGVYANIMARFTAESSCYGGDGYCRVRMLVSENGGAFTEMYPNTGSDYAFDGSQSGAETISSWESHAMERFWYGDPGSSYQVKVQYSSSNSGTTFWIDEWSFVAETDLQTSDYIPF